MPKPFHRRKPVTISAGLALVKERRKILLVHPTNARWWGTYGIPKGIANCGEEPLAAAIRETFEEVKVLVYPQFCVPGGTIEYRNRHGTLYKVVHYWWVDVTPLGLPDILPKIWLQMNEVDWAGFLTRVEAERRVFRRFQPLLDALE